MDTRKTELVMLLLLMSLTLFTGVSVIASDSEVSPVLEEYECQIDNVENCNSEESSGFEQADIEKEEMNQELNSDTENENTDTSAEQTANASTDSLASVISSSDNATFVNEMPASKTENSDGEPGSRKIPDLEEATKEAITKESTESSAPAEGAISANEMPVSAAAYPDDETKSSNTPDLEETAGEEAASGVVDSIASVTSSLNDTADENEMLESEATSTKGERDLGNTLNISETDSECESNVDETMIDPKEGEPQDDSEELVVVDDKLLRYVDPLERQCMLEDLWKTVDKIEKLVDFDKMESADRQYYLDMNNVKGELSDLSVDLDFQVVNAFFRLYMQKELLENVKITLFSDSYYSPDQDEKSIFYDTQPEFYVLEHPQQEKKFIVITSARDFDRVVINLPGISEVEVRCPDKDGSLFMRRHAKNTEGEDVTIYFLTSWRPIGAGEECLIGGIVAAKGNVSTEESSGNESISSYTTVRDLRRDINTEASQTEFMKTSGTVDSQPLHDFFIFISSADSDRAQVNHYTDLLQAYGGQFRFGDHTTDQTEAETVEERIRKASAFIVFLSDEALSDANVRKEIECAIDNGIPVICAFLEECDMSAVRELQLDAFPHVDMFQENGIDILNETLQRKI